MSAEAGLIGAVLFLAGWFLNRIFGEKKQRDTRNIIAKGVDSVLEADRNAEAAIKLIDDSNPDDGGANLAAYLNSKRKGDDT